MDGPGELPLGPVGGHVLPALPAVLHPPAHLHEAAGQGSGIAEGRRAPWEREGEGPFTRVARRSEVHLVKLCVPSILSRLAASREGLNSGPSSLCLQGVRG